MAGNDNLPELFFCLEIGNDILYVLDLDVKIGFGLVKVP